MKIAILTSGILPVPAVQGGAVENLIDYYLEYNNQHQLHDITVYSICLPKGYKTPKTPKTHYKYIDTVSLWGRLKRRIFSITHKSIYYNKYIEYYFYEALKDIKIKEYDIIVLENRPGYAIPLSKISNAKIIIHLHNDLLNKDSKLAHEICQVCDKVITVSDYIKQRVETIDCNIPVVTVYNGIDLGRFYNAIPIDRKKLGLKKDDFVVVYSGRIIKEKGIEELIDAFILLKENTKIKLLVIGGNFYGISDNSFLNNLKKKYETIIDSIIFTGFVPYEQLPQYLKAGDIAIVPSIWEEPFGLTCVEAMSAGLPLIVTNSGGLPEIINKEYTIIVDKNETSQLPHSIAKNILKLYLDQKQLAIMSKAGIERSLLFNKVSYSALFFKSYNYNISNNQESEI